MTAEYSVVDADAHYMEPLDEIAEYMDEPWRSRLLNGGDAGKNAFMPSSSGDPFMWGKLDRGSAGTDYPHDAMEESDIREGMEYLNIDETIVISQNVLILTESTADDDRLISFARGYVRYMLDNVVDPDDGIYTALPVPYYDVDASVELLEEYGDEPGIVGACIITYQSELTPPLGNRRYDPIYEVCEIKNLPVIFHTGGGSLDNYQRQGYESILETHTLGFLESNMGQLTSVVTRGIPEKFPDLTIVFQESGVLWVPTIMYRLDVEYLKRQEEAPLLDKRPSEYIKDFYFGTQPFETEANSQFLSQVIEELGGVDRLLYCSDYPHWDFDAVESITERPFLSEDDKRKILAGNAKRVFGL